MNFSDLKITSNNKHNTMKRLFNDFWDVLSFTAIMLLLVVIGIAITANHEVKSYYLKGGSAGSLQIGINVDWGIDESIYLDRKVTYSEAIEMVEKLNKTIK